MTMPAAHPRATHAFSLPNMLTYGRLILVPVIAGLLLYAGPRENAARWMALVLFIVAAVTDFFDGYLARKWQLQSSLGRMLDPIADKVLVAVVLLILASDSILYGGHIWAAAIILSREVLVSGLREYLGGLRVSVPVTRIAKWKTTAQLIAIGLLIAGPPGNAIVPWFTDVGLGFLWLAAGLTLYTGYDYFRAGLKHVVNR
jgi:cardiolipin synthase (CMP-forming)